MTYPPKDTGDTSTQPVPPRPTLSADIYRLTDIHAVPALSDVTPTQALSYFNQMLENLLLFHKNDILTPEKFRDSTSSSGSSTESNTTPIGREGSSVSLASTVVESPPPSMSPKTEPRAFSPNSDFVSPLTTLRRPSLAASSSDRTPQSGFTSAKLADVNYILEEAASVAAAVINSTEYNTDSPTQHAPRVNVSFSSSGNGFNSSPPSPEKPSTNELPEVASEAYSTPESVKSRNLERKAVTKDELSDKIVIIRRFIGKKKPDITIWSYLQRMHHYTPMSTSVYLTASLYIYRLCIYLQTFLLSPFSAHRLILATLRVACKNIEDNNFTQKRFATVSGITTTDLYRLEIAFLFLIDFDLCIDAPILQHHLVALTELQIQAERYRQSLRKRPRTSDVS